jgi:hypothetical protein
MLVKALFKGSTFIWALLVGLTIVSWLMIETKLGLTSLEAVYFSVVVILISSEKVFFMMFNFMEFNHAPLWLKLILGTWLIAITSILLIIYLASPL